MNYQRKANLVLGSVFLIFLLALWLRYQWPTVQGVRFFLFVSEAALVGGLADWFAVTALFRKPLGWSYHTALIPRNREKMTEAIVAMVQNELLSESLMRQKIQGFQLSTWFINTIEKSGGAPWLAEKLSQGLAQWCKNADISQLSNKIEALLKAKMLTAGLAKPMLVQGRLMLEKQEFDQLLDQGIEKVLDLATQPQAREILVQVLGQIQEQQVGNGGKLQKTILGLFQVTDGINLEEAAEGLQIELILHLRELQMPHHAVRGQLKEIIAGKLGALETDVEALNALENWKNTFFAEAKLEAPLRILLEQIFESLREGKLPTGQELALFLQPALEKWWPEFREDSALQHSLDQFVQDMLIQALQSEHAVIGQIVRETLQSLNEEELNRFIEDKAGNDLQWIRINGSLVGGMVGAVLFVVLNYGYSPLLELIR
ncbi:MAG: DUF445 domain-containing protein [Desulfitobacterium sp.]